MKDLIIDFLITFIEVFGASLVIIGLLILIAKELG